MTLKQLEAFYWAACCSSFSLAAQRVHITVSSLSKRIVELEQSIGTPLFERHINKTTLTDAGRLLLPQAQALLEDAERLRRLVSHNKEMHGTCRFGVGELSALTWLPKLVAHAKAAHPHLLLEPAVEAGSSSGALGQRILEGKLDFAVVAGRSLHPDMQCHTVGQASFAWVGAPALVGRTRKLDARMLEDHAVVTLPDGTATLRVLEQWLDAADQSIRRRLTCNSWGAVAGLLTEGLGIGFMPTRWAQALAKSRRLVLLQADTPLNDLHYLFLRRADDRRQLLEHMLAMVRKTIDFNVPGTWLHG